MNILFFKADISVSSPGISIISDKCFPFEDFENLDDCKP